MLASKDCRCSYETPTASWLPGARRHGKDETWGPGSAAASSHLHFAVWEQRLFAHVTTEPRSANPAMGSWLWKAQLFLLQPFLCLAVPVLSCSLLNLFSAQLF